MSDEIKRVGAGPFAVGDRVYVRRFESGGTITEVGETQIIRAFSGGNDAGELREVTRYVVELDNGVEQGIADRDGQLARA
jgi:hypothetical protein